MTKLVQKTIVAFAILLPLSLYAQSASEQENKSKDLATYFTVTGSIEDKFHTMVEEKLKAVGFDLTDPHKRVNDQYEAKWGSTTLDVLSFMPIVNNKAILPLLNIDPRIAGFAPFNLVIHKKLDENVTYVGHLVPKVMLDILQIKNKKVREAFTNTFSALDKTIEKEIGGYKAIIPYKKLPEKTMINFEYEFDTPEDMDDFIDEFQNNIELAFINKGYLIAGFHNFMEASHNAEEILANYDAFWTYSLCHLEFSYNVFDNKGARPEAGLFAPCTMYMYIKNGSNKVVVGMFRLQNWSDTLDIKDEKRLGMIKRLDREIPEILTNFGMVATPNVNPLTSPQSLSKSKTSKKAPSQKVTATPTNTQHSIDQRQQHIKVGDKVVDISVPSVPSVIKIDSSSSFAASDRSIKFSKRVPPNYRPDSFDRKLKEKVSTHTRIGQVNKGQISAYLRAPYLEVTEVEKRLKAAGFDIITSASLKKDNSLISIVFTDKSLVSLASKPNKGFIGSLRALVDTKEKTMSISNPLYMIKGFMQDAYDEKVANKLLARIVDQFPNLNNSRDSLKFQLLPKYQFMKGMPHYENMVEVAAGDNLLEKIRNNEKVLFTQKLDHGATLIGIQLSKRTNKFTKRIGRNNAAMLPYPILIEDGKAKILDPKYYISFMYPKLTMSEFMTIATIPDAIIKDCERIFK